VTTVTTHAFVKDDRTENWIRSYDVKFSGPKAIHLSDIDRKTSRHNQARPLAINPEGVDRYRQALRNGQKLPAIIVHKVNGKWVIIDGNNRDQAACDEKYETALAYIIDPATPSETILLMTVAANVNNGMAVEKNWSLQNALYLVNSGFAKDVVAKYMNLSVSAISAHQREYNAGVRAAGLRIDRWNDMPIRTRQVIGGIKLDKPFVIMAEAAIATKAAYNPELAATVTAIHAAANEDDAVAIAREWAKAVIEHAKQNERMGRKGATSNPKLALLTGLGKVKNFKLGLFNATFATDEDRRVLNNHINDTLKVLLEMKYRLLGKEETEQAILDMVDTLGDIQNTKE
jgi:hypothetical protein